MSQETISEEIRWQVGGREDYARHNPRYYTYRVITVLGLDMNLDTIYSIDEQIVKFAGEDEDDEDSFQLGDEWWDVDVMDYDPDQYEDENFEEDPNEWPETPPLSEEEEAELLVNFPDELDRS